MSRSGVAVGVAMFLILTVVASGCVQRETRFQYEKKVKKIYNVRQESLSSMTSLSYDDPSKLESAKAEIDASIRDLRRIKPPRNVQQAHDSYITSLQGESKVLAKLTVCAQDEQANAGSGQSCRSDIDSTLLDTIDNDFRDAVAIYRKEGYDLPQTQTQN